MMDNVTIMMSGVILMGLIVIGINYFQNKNNKEKKHN